MIKNILDKIFDITKYQPLDPDIRCINLTMFDTAVELEIKQNPDYEGPDAITISKNDTIALAKHFRLTEIDLK